MNASTLNPSRMQLALGPLQYYWSRAQTLQFYEGITDAPVDIVYLGETVCSRRHELRLPDWLDVADMLSAAGKQVVMSTQVLLESGADLTTLRKIADNDRYLVEANDMGAVRLMQGRPFVAGPFLNVYNAPTRDLFADLGAVRWVMPLEMGRDTLMQIQQASRQDAGDGISPISDALPSVPGGQVHPLPVEVFAYGKLPLAFSARCFTARNRNIPKDNCQYVCMAYPDGLLLNTREGQPFLTINGIQTQSALVYCLIDQLPALRQMHVGVLRISPQSQHMDQVLGAFRQAIDGELDGRQAFDRLRDLMPQPPCNGYWHGRPGLELVA